MMTIARMMTMLSWQRWWTLTHGVTATTPPWQVGSPRADTDTRTGGCCVLLVHVIAIRTTINIIIVSKTQKLTTEYEEEEEHWAGNGGEWCSEASKGLKRGRKGRKARYLFALRRNDVPAFNQLEKSWHCFLAFNRFSHVPIIAKETMVSKSDKKSQ